MQVDLFGWIESMDDGSSLPSLADARNLAQLNFWKLSSNEAQLVVWQANANR